MNRRLLHVLLAVTAAVGLGASAWALLYAGGDAWLAHTLGIYNESGPFYAFWSGFGSDIGEVTIVAAILGAGATVYKVHLECELGACHWPRWRQYQDADGRLHHWCRKHHPDEPLHKRDHAEFLRRHETRKAKAKAARSGE